jgi:hypothetical protein
MLFRQVDATYAGADFSNVCGVGVGEMSVRKGHQYISVFADLVKKRVRFAAAEGKDQEPRLKFLEALENTRPPAGAHAGEQGHEARPASGTCGTTAGRSFNNQPINIGNPLCLGEGGCKNMLDSNFSPIYGRFMKQDRLHNAASIIC